MITSFYGDYTISYCIIAIQIQQKPEKGRERMIQEELNKKIVQTLIEQLELLNKYLNEVENLSEKLSIHDHIMHTVQMMIGISSL